MSVSPYLEQYIDCKIDKKIDLRLKSLEYMSSKKSLSYNYYQRLSSIAKGNISVDDGHNLCANILPCVSFDLFGSSSKQVKNIYSLLFDGAKHMFSK